MSIHKATQRYLSQEQVEHFIKQFWIKIGALRKDFPEAIHDEKDTQGSKNSLGFNARPFMGYSNELLPQIEDIVKKEYPNIKFVESYIRQYNGIGSSLAKHTDVDYHPNGPYDITLSICLKDETEWPLWFEMPEGNIGYTMDPGYGVLCEAQKIKHWRDPQPIDKPTMFIFYHWMLT